MNAQDTFLFENRKNMDKDEWIAKAMELHPNRTRKETEDLWQIIFEYDTKTIIAKNLAKQFEDY